MACRPVRLPSLLVFSLFAVAACSRPAPVVSSETSYTIAAKLVPSKTHPLTGFWRSACDDNFGLAIRPAGPGVYSISFCGPGGCFEPGTYRPDSAIAGDPSYRILDDDTIELSTTKGFQAVHRCRNRPLPPPKCDVHRTGSLVSDGDQ